MRHLKKILTFVLAACFTFSLTGCSLATMLSSSDGKPISFKSASDLESGKAYVWLHEGANIEEDLKNGSDKNIFFTCISGDYNFTGQELDESSMYPRSRSR